MRLRASAFMLHRIGTPAAVRPAKQFHTAANPETPSRIERSGIPMRALMRDLALGGGGIFGPDLFGVDERALARANGRVMRSASGIIALAVRSWFRL
jgi:hypothetical protein